MEKADLNDMFKKGLLGCLYITIVVLPGPLSPTPENKEEDPNDPKPPDEWHIQMESSSHSLYRPSIGSETKNYM